MSSDQTRTNDPAAATRVVLLRFSGDLTTKADATRRRMTSRLIENLRASIKASGRKARVMRYRNRIFVEFEPGPGPSDEEVASRLARVFGVESVSVTHVEANFL